MTRLEVIAAVSANGVIGNKGRIPWHIPQDLRNFRRITTGHAVVMGRKTWESLQAIKRAPLPNRTNIVVSSQMESSPDVTVVRSLAEARALGHPLLFVIGGAALYAEALPLADAVHLTCVHAVYPGDAFFPSWDMVGFGLVEGFDMRTLDVGDQDFSYLHYARWPALIPRPVVPWNALDQFIIPAGPIPSFSPSKEQGQEEVPDLSTRSAVHEELRQLGIDPHTLKERALAFVDEVKASLPKPRTALDGLRALRLFEEALKLTERKRGYRRTEVFDPWVGKPLVEGESPDHERFAGEISPAYERGCHWTLRLWVTQGGQHRLDSWNWDGDSRTTGTCAWDPTIEAIAQHLAIDEAALRKSIRHLGEDD